MANKATASNSFTFLEFEREKKDLRQRPCLKRIIAEMFRICKLPTDSANVKQFKEKHMCIAQPHKARNPDSKAKMLT